MEAKIYDIKQLDEEKRIDELKNLLQAKGIRVSHQRLLILNYLILNDTHPSAEKIFKDLKAIDPVISQATVYNTLNLLAEQKIVKELDFNMASKRYEFAKTRHSHFICESCGKIVDFEIGRYDRPEDLADYDLHTLEVVYRGLCPDCKED